MAIEFKTPTEVAEEYLQHLKALKPEVNTKQTDSDWWVRSRVVGGTMSGLYADQLKIADDAFPGSARREAVERHLSTWLDRGFNAAQKSTGPVLVTGTIGSTISTGTEFVYDPNGNSYQSTETKTIDAASGVVVAVESVVGGQSQNLLEGAELTLPSPPAGVDSTATVTGGNISDGRNEESTEEAAEAVLTRIQQRSAGGTETDYENFAKEADASVSDVNVIRHYLGLGTVAIVITAGTTDIDAAIDAGDAIVLTPSSTLVQAVLEYVDAVNPLTDCITVLPAGEIAIDVTVRVKFLSGDSDTVVTVDDQNFTQADLVRREVRRAVYKTPLGGRRFGTSASGFVVAAEIEEVIDSNLSADPHAIGNKGEFVTDRRVDDLAVTGRNRSLAAVEVAVPGTITVIEE